MHHVLLQKQDPGVRQSVKESVNNVSLKENFRLAIVAYALGQEKTTIKKETKTTNKLYWYSNPWRGATKTVDLQQQLEASELRCRQEEDSRRNALRTLEDVAEQERQARQSLEEQLSLLLQERRKSARLQKQLEAAANSLEDVAELGRQFRRPLEQQFALLRQELNTLQQAFNAWVSSWSDLQQKLED